MNNELVKNNTKKESTQIASSFLAQLKNSWRDAWATEGFAIKLGATIATFIVGALQFPTYLNHIQHRKGIVLNDLVLNYIPATDVSYLIFGIIYGLLVYMLVRTLKNAQLFLLFAITFMIETVLRMTSIYFVPLDAPLGLINLSDPLTEALVYSSNQPITKDLFFSGHTSTMVMIWIFLQKPLEKKIGGIACITLAFLLLLQHIHYTADVLAAFVFTYLSYLLAKILILKNSRTVLVFMLLIALVLQMLFLKAYQYQ
ncbi:MAG: phosphatase PAP2-related protein [Spirosomataceae bacterium]